MGAKRKTLSKKTRFEVFKRDSFKCQYCGASSPEAVLVVDHIDPISKNGADEMVNYITACQPCNAGKSDRKLDDNTTLSKQKAQLDELNERREQLEMMLQWRSGMKDIGDSQLEAAFSHWRAATPGFNLKEESLNKLRKHIKDFGLSNVLDAIDTAAEQYHKFDEEGNLQRDSVEAAWQKLGGVARIKAMPEDERQLHYIKGILRSRLSWIPYDVMKYLKYAAEDGVPLEDLRLEARAARSWTQYLDFVVKARRAASGES